MRTTSFALAAVLSLSTLALAGGPKQVNMPVGYTTTLSMPAPVATVTVEDPSLVEVSTQGRRVVLVGLSRGRTVAVVKTAAGEQRLSIYVAADKYALPAN